MMAGSHRSREQSRVSWEVNSVRHTGLREGEESTVTPRFLALVNSEMECVRRVHCEERGRPLLGSWGHLDGMSRRHWDTQA